MGDSVGVGQGYATPLLVAVRAVIQESPSSHGGGGRQRNDRKDFQGLGVVTSVTLPGSHLPLPGRLALLCQLLRFDQSHWETRPRHDAGHGAAGLRHGSHAATVGAEAWRREVADAVVAWLVARLVSAPDPSAFHRPLLVDKGKGIGGNKDGDSLLKDVVQGVAGLVSGSPTNGFDNGKEDLSDQVRCDLNFEI